MTCRKIFQGLSVILIVAGLPRSLTMRPHTQAAKAMKIMNITACYLPYGALSSLIINLPDESGKSRQNTCKRVFY